MDRGKGSADNEGEGARQTPSDRKELLPHKASRRPSFEGQMLTWLTRILLVVGGVLASWSVAKVEPNWNVIQGVTAMLLMAPTVVVVAFGPKR